MLTDDDLSEILLPLMPLKDPYVFARAVETAVRKTCEVACAQALLHARADELDQCIKVCADLANDEEFGHLYATGAGEAERLLCERREPPND
jgi:uncharacterized ParB-like nuclease family protein